MPETVFSGRCRGRVLLLALGASATVTLALASPANAAPKTLAFWQMNEPTLAKVMTDSSANKMHGTIGGIVKTGVPYGDAIGYRFPFVPPNQPPAAPARLVTVSDARLNPDSAHYAVTLRFRSTYNFGNMIQKGQAGARGGYWKFEHTRGRVTCLYRGAAGSSAVSSGSTPLNNGAYHIVRCERTGKDLSMTVDGVEKARKAGATGRISNDVPLTIGGKINCDQVKVTCDYFTGDIDYVKIEKG